MNLKCFMLTQLHSQVREICSENIVKTLTAFIFFPMRGMMYLSYGTVFSHLSLENKNVGKHFYLLLKIFGRKQLSRDVLRKRCYENMQQIYRRTSMLKGDFNNVAKQLYWNHTSASVFSCKFAAYFQNTSFIRTPPEDCFCLLQKTHIINQICKCFSSFSWSPVYADVRINWKIPLGDIKLLNRYQQFTE